MLVVSHSLSYLILITLLSEQLIYFKHVMLWPLVVQDNFDFMRHNVSGNFGNCRWNMADDKASSRSDRRENYKWKVSKLVRTVIVKWCKEIIERCFAISLSSNTCESTVCSKCRRLPRAPLCTHVQGRAACRRSVSFQGCLEHLLASQDQRKIQDIKQYTVWNFETISTGWKNVDQR